jgi:hypothetical protein
MRSSLLVSLDVIYVDDGDDDDNNNDNNKDDYCDDCNGYASLHVVF